MPTSRHRPARRLLVAGCGLAAVLFGGSFACGGGPVSGGAPSESGFTGGATGGFGPGGTNGLGGTTGAGTPIQYCGVSDGGLPVACDESTSGGTGYRGPDGG